MQLYGSKPGEGPMLRSGLAILERLWIQCSSLSRGTALGSGQSRAWWLKGRRDDNRAYTKAAGLASRISSYSPVGSHLARLGLGGSPGSESLLAETFLRARKLCTCWRRRLSSWLQACWTVSTFFTSQLRATASALGSSLMTSCGKNKKH